LRKLVRIPAAVRGTQWARAAILLGLVWQIVPPAALPTEAASATTATLTGGSGTQVASGSLYAKKGAPLTLVVNTTSDTFCVKLSGDQTGQLNTNAASVGKTTWTFNNLKATDGDGVRTIIATSYADTSCSSAGPLAASVSYIADNTGPLVSGAVNPAPNAAGWNKTAPVSISWSASDAGVGVASLTPSTSSVSNNGTTTLTAQATDVLGNSAKGSATVELDTQPPTISASRSPGPNSNGWNNTAVTVSFSCGDQGPSGIKSCPSASTLSGDGANQSVTGVAVDNADNQSSTTVGSINIDTTPPTLSGAPASAPNAAGWYNTPVTINWTCADGLSGIDGTCPSPATINGNGQGLTAPAIVKDRAGNQTNATSPGVNIDSTSPKTTVTAPAGWTNQSVTVSFSATDNLSGVKATWYSLDGAAAQSGSSLTISTEGVHSLAFWSEDFAGNVESARNVAVKIDLTPPTITHDYLPEPNARGWNNGSTTITFDCKDLLSGIVSCTPPQTVTTEGQAQAVPGTAVDVAGNTAADPASVSIDETPPSISAVAASAPNAFGWYNAPVNVHFTCADALSGVASCSVDAILTSDGANQSVSGTAVDAADNSGTASVTGINIDRTPPTLNGAPTTAAGLEGWYRSDVTVGWTCSDALSGLNGACPSSSTITGEGADLSAAASVSDLAGNLTTTTVGGIKIDRTPPSTTVSVPAALASGWYGGPVTVTLSAVDGLSGVHATFYSVDGGAAQEYSAPFVHATGGSHTISFWSVDRAGNVEDATANQLTLKIDNIPPTVTFSGNLGTYSVDQLVNINCAASDAESGLASTTCQNVNQFAGTYQVGSNTLTASATDRAGNVGHGSTSFTVTVGLASLCRLTVAVLLPPGTPTQGCNVLNQVGASLTATQKALFVKAYDAWLTTQVGKGLTADQSSMLVRVAGSVS